MTDDRHRPAAALSTSTPPPRCETVDVCVVGAGPAGITCALTLARQGHRVIVVEGAAHFQRNFRGESISPDGVFLLERLGILDDIVARGTLTVERLEISEGGRLLLRTEFRDFPFPSPYPMEVPQPTLLSVLAAAAAEHPGFAMRTAVVTDLIEEDGEVRGVRCRGPEGESEVRASLVVGADGRYSKVRALSRLEHERTPLERDVVWLRVPQPAGWDGAAYRVRLDRDRHGLFIPTYPDELRIGFNIPKGGLKELRRDGIDALYDTIASLEPAVEEGVRSAVPDWSSTSMLDIFTVTTPCWSRPGLVLVGDAAHTLTPILGQGVNHALIDGYELAQLLDRPLHATARRRHELLAAATLRWQSEREPAIRTSRALQMRQERAFTLSGTAGVAARSALYRAVNRSAYLRRRVLAPAYFDLQARAAA